MQPNIATGMTSARFFAWVLLLSAIVLSFVPPELRPQTGEPHFVEHFAIFVLIGLAFGIGYPDHTVALLVGAVAFTAVLEVLQLFVPGRHARLSDFLIDAGAAWLGIVSASGLSRLRG